MKQDASLPLSATVAGLKAFPQEERQCAAAALATVLAWADPPGEPPDKLSPLLYNPGREGAFYFDITRELRLRGLLVYQIGDGLTGIFTLVADSTPVIVLENRGLTLFAVNHWSVVGGYDLNGRQIQLYEGGPEAVAKSLDTFSRTFARSGSVALSATPAPFLPKGAHPVPLLTAITDLEAVAGAKKALAFYRTFVLKFPLEWHGHLALANALHATGDPKAAREELTSAARLSPARPEPINNLAMLLAEEGDWQGAETLADEALQKASALKLDLKSYEDTMRRAKNRNVR